MSSTPSPRVAVLAGINGAGKTTASTAILRDVYRFPVFTNADVIARGLNMFDPEAEPARAGRVMLEWLDDLAADRRDFGFETTLAARAYAGRLRDLKAVGYQVILIYLWLDSPELAIGRVAGRVRSGGHHVPDATVRQRYTRSVRNFLELYRPLADIWEVYDNTHGDRVLVAIGSPDDELVADESRWEQFQRSADDA